MLKFLASWLRRIFRDAVVGGVKDGLEDLTTKGVKLGDGQTFTIEGAKQQLADMLGESVTIDHPEQLPGVTVTTEPVKQLEHEGEVLEHEHEEEEPQTKAKKPSRKRAGAKR